MSLEDTIKEAITGRSTTNKKDIIETNQMRICENSFVYESSVLQISNMSSVSVAPFPPKAISSWMVICILAGLLSITYTFWVGLFLIAIGIVAIIYVYNYNLNKGHYLKIIMNSGSTYYFNCADSKFLYKIKNVMMQCMNDPKKSFNIDLRNSIIRTMQVGDYNTVAENVYEEVNR